MDRRALPGLLAGVVGGLIGVLAIVTGNAILGFAAGLAALGAGAAVAVLAGRLREAEQTAVAGVAVSDPTPSVASAPSIPEWDEPTISTENLEPSVLAGPATQLESPRRADQVADQAGARTEAPAEPAATVVAEAVPVPGARGPESVFDSETGLLDERVFVVSFERKVAAARRHLRPLCLVLIDLGTGLPPEGRERYGALQRFGTVVRDTLRDADIACRLSATAFGLILEDTPEAGGVWAAERLQIALACQRGGPKRMAAAVAAYPNHGLAAQEVLQRAQDALIRARSSTEDGMGPVEVASSDFG